jgi:hypothetical protein
MPCHIPEIYEFDSYHTRINAEDKLISPQLVGKYRITDTNTGDLKNQINP